MSIPASKWAAVFDWDGVIVDSSSAHEASWERLAKESGFTLPEGHFLRGFGMKNEEIIPDMLGWTRNAADIARLSRRKEELFRDEVRRAGGIQPLPGVREWMDLLDRHGVPRAIASSTHRENIELILGLIGLKGFSAIVTAEDVQRGKPAPDVFLAAAERMGVPPRCCIVFEDTAVGLEAARAAGMRCVGIATTHPAESLAAADMIVRRMDELDPLALADGVARGSGFGYHDPRRT